MLTALQGPLFSPAPQESPLAAWRDIQPESLIEEVVPQVTPPMEFRKWLEVVKSYAEAASRRQASLISD